VSPERAGCHARACPGALARKHRDIKIQTLNLAVPQPMLRFELECPQVRQISTEKPRPRQGPSGRGFSERSLELRISCVPF
jgi:hypothetical protein